MLDIARRIRTHLAAAGVRVVMTREDDRFWTLKDRPYIASRGGGDVFVSIHINTAGSRTANGVETFVTPAEHYPPTSESRLNKSYPRKINNRFNHSNSVLGSQIQRSIIGITRATDRGLKHARFAVLRDTSMPAALVECGFFSNPSEEKRLNTPSYRETLAKGIAQGILNYLAIVNRARIEMGAPLIQQPTRVASASSVAPANPVAHFHGRPFLGSFGTPPNKHGPSHPDRARDSRTRRTGGSARCGTRGRSRTCAAGCAGTDHPDSGHTA